jgi:hypothetical protein
MERGFIQILLDNHAKASLNNVFIIPKNKSSSQTGKGLKIETIENIENAKKYFKKFE